MKQLIGSDIAAYVKERQAKQVRGLRQAHAVEPRLAIVQLKDDPVIDTYVRLKKAYGSDIGVEVSVHRVQQSDAEKTIKDLNNSDAVHGIIVQLPIADEAETDAIVNLVAPYKDVDALGIKGTFSPATPMAILWLLSGHNIELKGKSILLVGKGRLVGAPLERQLSASNLSVEVVERDVADLKSHTLKADVIITATGSPAILYSDMIKEGTVVVDAGVASESGKTVGDLADDVYERNDIIVTPRKGGVGPLTVCALFENVIRAASSHTNQ